VGTNEEELVNSWEKLGCSDEYQQIGLLKAILIRAKKVRFSVRAIFPLSPSILPIFLHPKVTLFVQDVSGLVWFSLWLTSPLYGYQPQV
jgi:hypothetical protein